MMHVSLENMNAEVKSLSKLPVALMYTILLQWYHSIAGVLMLQHLYIYLTKPDKRCLSSDLTLFKYMTQILMLPPLIQY